MKNKDHHILDIVRVPPASDRRLDMERCDPENNVHVIPNIKNASFFVDLTVKHVQWTTGSWNVIMKHQENRLQTNLIIVLRLL